MKNTLKKLVAVAVFSVSAVLCADLRVTEILQSITARQLPDGAWNLYADHESIRIAPARVNRALATALTAGPQDKKLRKAAVKWFDWYASNQFPDGGMTDFNGKHGTYSTYSESCSPGTYAASHIIAYAKYAALPGAGVSPIQMESVKKSFQALVNQLDPADALAWNSSARNAKHLAENLEIHQALAAAHLFFTSRKETTQAQTAWKALRLNSESLNHFMIKDKDYLAKTIYPNGKYSASFYWYHDDYSANAYAAALLGKFAVKPWNALKKALGADMERRLDKFMYYAAVAQKDTVMARKIREAALRDLRTMGRVDLRDLQTLDNLLAVLLDSPECLGRAYAPGTLSRPQKESDRDSAEKELADELQAYLSRKVLPFWTSPDLRDEKHGGWLNAVDSEGKRLPQKTKPLIAHLRLLYVYATAVKAADSEKEAEELRRYYHKNLKFLSEKFSLPSGGYADSLNVDSTHPEPVQRKVISNLYALYVLSETAMLLPDKTALSAAEQQYQILKQAWDETYGGFFSRFPDAEDLHTGKNMAFKETALNFHALQALDSYVRATGAKEAHSRLETLYAIVSAKFLEPKSSHGYTILARDWTPPPGALKEICVYGHDIELLWYSLNAGNTLKKSDAEMLEWVLPGAEAVLRDVISENGSVRNYGTFDGTGKDRKIHFWCQAEAMILFMKLYRITGDAKWFEAFRIVKEWTFRYCARENGVWVLVLESDGSIAPGTFPGAEWVAGLHVTRMLTEVLRDLNRNNEKSIFATRKH